MLATAQFHSTGTPIEGNEDLINNIIHSIENGTYRDNEDFGKTAAAFRSQQKQRNSSERDVEGQRGEDAKPVSLDLRQSSERGEDNAQGNSDEPAGEVASEGGIKFRKVTNPFKVAELEAGDKVYRAMQLIGDKLYRSIS